MKCKNCGAEMKEGHVYCETCGYEVHIVPDYNIELEEKMTKTLERLVKEELQGQQKTQNETVKKVVKKKNRLLLSVVAVLILVSVFGILAVNMIYRQSYEFQFAKGVEAKSRQQYEQAVQYFKKALEKKPENKELYLDMAEAYDASGNETEAEACYITLIKLDENNIKAYSALIAMYEKQEKWNEIQNLLSECKNGDILSAFTDYRISEPVCTISEDLERGIVTIELKSSYQEKIYYTLDGSDVSAQSQVYTDPIVIQSRDIDLQVMCMNPKGITSEVLTEQYVATAKKEGLGIFPETGVYRQPEWITVEVPFGSRVYYTYEERPATSDDYEYTGPLRMYIGDSHMTFTLYDENGEACKTEERSYTLRLNTKYHEEDVVAALKNKLIENGDMENRDGKIEGSKNTYSFRCRYAITVDDVVYLLVDQYLVNPSGKSERIQIFAIDGDNTEKIYIAERDYEQGYKLKKFS